MVLFFKKKIIEKILSFESHELQGFFNFQGFGSLEMVMVEFTSMALDFL